MFARFENAMSATIALGTLVVAATLVHREFGSRVPKTIRAAAKPPTVIKDWHAVLNAGVLIGDSMARVKIVEFGDFECPYCRRFESAVRAVRSQFGANVALIFVHDPLTQIHRFALPAARAAECAALQGRFAAFHDVVYDKQDSLGLKTWTSMASDASVPDTTVFSECYRAGGVPDRVATGLALARNLDIHGTPTVLVNGWRLYTPPDDTTLITVVEAALNGPGPLASLMRSYP